MDFEAQWKKVIEKEALLQAEVRQNLQLEVLAEFEKMKSEVLRIEKDFVASGENSIEAKVSELSIQFLNTSIIFHDRGAKEFSGLTSSIIVTQGLRGPIEYFGARSKTGEIIWQIASGVVSFRTDQLLSVLL